MIKSLPAKSIIGGRVTPTFEALPAPTDHEFDQIRRIYEASFPRVHQKPFIDMVNGVRSGSITLLVVRNESRAITGFATLLRLPNTPTLYLVYFALDAAARSQGTGSDFFRYMVDHIARRGDVDTLVWEVEAPETDNPDEIHRRRIRFYERLGAQIVTLALNYRMVDFEKGEGTIPLRLMWLSLPNRSRPLTRADVTAWIRDIYALVYQDTQWLADQIIAEINAAGDPYGLEHP